MYNRILPFQSLWIFLILSFIFTSCKTDKDKDRVYDDVDKELNTPPNVPVDSLGREIKREISNIHFYIETSASMAGYMAGSTDFSEKLPNLLVDIQNRVEFKNKKIICHFIGDRDSLFNGDLSKFNTEFSTRRIARERSSPMHDIFSTITNNLDSNSIALFVSDCILSYPDPEIKINSKINKEKAPGDLKSKIKDAFYKIKSKNYGASVYGFNSSFNGIYFAYDNTKMRLDGNIKRPYYLWVIGQKELVNKINATLNKIDGFSPELVIDFGLITKPITDYSLLYEKHKIGKWYADNNDLKEINIRKGKTLTFSIAIDLSNIPPYYTTVKYIEENIKIKDPNAKVNLLSVSTNDEVYSKDLAVPNDIIKNPHILIFSISELISNTKIDISLPLIYDTTYKSWAIDDDLNKNMINGKTFAFNHLVDGVKDAYQNVDNDIFKFSINLKK